MSVNNPNKVNTERRRHMFANEERYIASKLVMRVHWTALVTLKLHQNTVTRTSGNGHLDQDFIGAGSRYGSGPRTTGLPGPVTNNAFCSAIVSYDARWELVDLKMPSVASRKLRCCCAQIQLGFKGYL